MKNDINTKQNINKLIGLKLKELRIKSNKKQKDIAKQLGYHQTIISNIELGKKAIDVDNLYTLSLIYNVKIEYFFTNL